MYISSSHCTLLAARCPLTCLAVHGRYGGQRGESVALSEERNAVFSSGTGGVESGCRSSPSTQRKGSVPGAAARQAAPEGDTSLVLLPDPGDRRGPHADGVASSSPLSSPVFYFLLLSFLLLLSSSSLPQPPPLLFLSSTSTSSSSSTHFSPSLFFSVPLNDQIHVYCKAFKQKYNTGEIDILVIFRSTSLPPSPPPPLLLQLLPFPHPLKSDEGQPDSINQIRLSLCHLPSPWVSVPGSVASKDHI